jgi:peroxiredoxin
LAGYEERREAFRELGVSMIAGSVDSEEKTLEVASDLGFPVAYGVTRAMGDAMGAWWEERRDHIQPSEFVLRQDGRVLGSTYSTLPIGRMDPEETLTLMTFLTSRGR